MATILDLVEYHTHPEVHDYQHERPGSPDYIASTRVGVSYEEYMALLQAKNYPLMLEAIEKRMMSVEQVMSPFVKALRSLGERIEAVMSQIPREWLGEMRGEFPECNKDLKCAVENRMRNEAQMFRGTNMEKKKWWEESKEERAKAWKEEGEEKEKNLKRKMGKEKRKADASGTLPKGKTEVGGNRAVALGKKNGPGKEAAAAKKKPEVYVTETIKRVSLCKRVFRLILKEKLPEEHYSDEIGGEAIYLDVFRLMVGGGEGDAYPKHEQLSDIYQLATAQSPDLDEIWLREMHAAHNAGAKEIGRMDGNGTDRVVIAGGGPAALMAAAEFFPLGWSIVIAEKRWDYTREHLTIHGPKVTMKLRLFLGTKFDEIFLKDKTHNTMQYEPRYNEFLIETYEVRAVARRLEYALKARLIKLATLLHPIPSTDSPLLLIYGASFDGIGFPTRAKPSFHAILRVQKTTEGVIAVNGTTVTASTLFEVSTSGIFMIESRMFVCATGVTDWSCRDKYLGIPLTLSKMEHGDSTMTYMNKGRNVRGKSLFVNLKQNIDLEDVEPYLRKMGFNELIKNNGCLLEEYKGKYAHFTELLLHGVLVTKQSDDVTGNDGENAGGRATHANGNDRLEIENGAYKWDDSHYQRWLVNIGEMEKNQVGIWLHYELAEEQSPKEVKPVFNAFLREAVAQSKAKLLRTQDGAKGDACVEFRILLHGKLFRAVFDYLQACEAEMFKNFDTYVSDIWRLAPNLRQDGTVGSTDDDGVNYSSMLYPSATYSAMTHATRVAVAYDWVPESQSSSKRAKENRGCLVIGIGTSVLNPHYITGTALAFSRLGIETTSRVLESGLKSRDFSFQKAADRLNEAHEGLKKLLSLKGIWEEDEEKRASTEVKFRLAREAMWKEVNLEIEKTEAKSGQQTIGEFVYEIHAHGHSGDPAEGALLAASHPKFLIRWQQVGAGWSGKGLEFVAAVTDDGEISIETLRQDGGKYGDDVYNGGNNPLKLEEQKFTPSYGTLTQAVVDLINKNYNNTFRRRALGY